jgi:hypothetical protein
VPVDEQQLGGGQRRSAHLKRAQGKAPRGRTRPAILGRVQPSRANLGTPQ